MGQGELDSLSEWRHESDRRPRVPCIKCGAYILTRMTNELPVTRPSNMYNSHSWAPPNDLMTENQFPPIDFLVFIFYLFFLNQAYHFKNNQSKSFSWVVMRHLKSLLLALDRYLFDSFQGCAPNVAFHQHHSFQTWALNLYTRQKCFFAWGFSGCQAQPNGSSFLSRPQSCGPPWRLK